MKITHNKKYVDVKPKIYINDCEIHFVKETRYLGFAVDDDMSDQSDIIRCRNKFYSVFNVLLRKFHYLDPNAFFELFKFYCLQLYGAELGFSSMKCNHMMHKFAVGFHKAIKKIWRCPYYVSNSYLCNHVNILKFEHFINMMKIRFLLNLYKSRNRLVLQLLDYFYFKSYFVR